MRQEINAITGQVVELPSLPPSVEPSPQPQSTTPVLYAAALLTIDAGTIDGIGIASKFSAAMWIDTGIYYIFFAETQPDMNYMVQAYDDGASRIRIIERSPDYIVVAITDESEAPIDPPTLSIEITRVN